jgi:hypothetical protein
MGSPFMSPNGMRDLRTLERLHWPARIRGVSQAGSRPCRAVPPGLAVVARDLTELVTTQFYGCVARP